MICAVGVCWHSLNHPVTELWKELEVRLLHLGERLDRLRLLVGVVEVFEDCRLRRKICDDLICVTAELY